MGNYIVINGKKAELTNEQLEKLGIKVEKDIFQRGDNVEYFYINESGEVDGDTDIDCPCNIRQFNVANYCTDEKVMYQRALHETLNRLLWRYSMQHDGDKIVWQPFVNHYRIILKHTSNTFEVYNNDDFQTIGAVYFYTEQIAENAIEEIVKPFMKKHPEFVW